MTICLILSVGLSLLGGCSVNNGYGYTVSDTFDTVIRVICYSDAAQAEQYGEIAHRELSFWHKLGDAYHPYEDVVGVYALNHSGGAWVEVSDQMLQLLTFGKQAYDATDGTVNMMCGAVTSLWKNTDQPPTKQAVEQALQHMDINALEIRGNQVRITDPLARIDMGAFAKGYALQKTADVLREQGFMGLLSAVSSVVAVGDKRGEPFGVGIGDGAGAVAVTIQARDIALSTSGTDQRFFKYEGETYHHIIDLKTGYPAKSGVSQASVVHAHAGWADVYSTAALIDGTTTQDALLRREGNFAYYGKIKEWI